MNKDLLTKEIFSRLQALVNKLKEDIPGFSEVSATLINLENLDSLQVLNTEARLNYLLDLSEKCIDVNQQFDEYQFKKGLDTIPDLDSQLTQETPKFTGLSMKTR